jgi:hypothetical protein
MVVQPADNDSAMSQEPLDFEVYNSIQRPRLLYKYFKYHAPDKCEWTQRIFKNNEIYFAAPKDFNDPFDSVRRFIYPRSTTEREHIWKAGLCLSFPQVPKVIMDDQVRELVRAGNDISHMETVCEKLTYQMQNENAVFCMTEKKDNILMWAHYADQHAGFCLEFETDNPFFSRVRPVIYRRCLPKQDLVEFLTTDISPLPLYLVTKAEDWAYEKEWRLAEPGTHPGQRKYPPSSLTGVIFGCRMDEKNKEQIKLWCRERETHPMLYEAKEKENEFGLDIISIPY